MTGWHPDADTCTDLLRVELDACVVEIERLRRRKAEALAFLDAWVVAAEDGEPLDVLRAQTLDWMEGA